MTEEQAIRETGVAAAAVLATTAICILSAGRVLQYGSDAGGWVFAWYIEYPEVWLTQPRGIETAQGDPALATTITGCPKAAAVVTVSATSPLSFRPGPVVAKATVWAWSAASTFMPSMTVTEIIYLK